MRRLAPTLIASLAALWLTPEAGSAPPPSAGAAPGADARAGLRLAAHLGDGMVLPRERSVAIKGVAAPGSAVAIAFAGQAKESAAGGDGRWSVTLDPMEASAVPREMAIQAGAETRTLHNVVVGDVWLCAGQSNMRWEVRQSDGASQSLAEADRPLLRLLDFRGSLQPSGKRYGREFLAALTADNYYATSGWQPSSAESAAGFSAVGYFFGCRLQAEAGFPVGIIHNAVGGVPIESYLADGDPAADWLGDPAFPQWCRERAAQNLAAWVERPDFPRPPHPFAPGFLWRAGMAALTDFPVKGFVWYQGESNATATPESAAADPQVNEEKLARLIQGWRTAWGDPSLPFLMVQLPRHDRDWAPFREAQAKVAAADPHTHLAVTIDLGDPANVHPKDKRPVGERLANLALAKVYGRQVDAEGPAFASCSFQGNAGTLSICRGEGLRATVTPPTGFEIAGEDRRFHPADARIENGAIIVSSIAVDAPKAVRYAWAGSPEASVVGASGLPLAPFRTDDWELAATESGIGTSFESAKPGGFTRLEIDGFDLAAAPGDAEITAKFAHTGSQCLRLIGDGECAVEIALPAAAKAATELRFQAERWTARKPFAFRIDAEVGGAWREIFDGDAALLVGARFRSAVRVMLPEGAGKIRLRCTAPPDSGALIDSLAIAEAKPMRVTGAKARRPAVPALIGKGDNPLLEIAIHAEGGLEPVALRQLAIPLRDGGKAIAGAHASLNGIEIGPLESDGAALVFAGEAALAEGENKLAIRCAIKPGTRLDERVSLGDPTIRLSDGSNQQLAAEGAPQRVGIALRTRGQDGISVYRIPGLAETKRGTLIAVYDNRHRGGGDLPGDIDIGMSRSTDGGQTWEPMKTIMDMGDDPQWRYDGIGDPAVLADPAAGTIWVAATWSHGNRSWNGSGPGLEPEETGQFMLVRSDDDGLTWSAPINITRQIKDPAWRFVLAGPGAGITLADGTLAFPAQFRDARGTPFSTIIWSKDRGETWAIGAGVAPNTNEAQIVQLPGGDIMINCRDFSVGGSRVVATTADLGETWVAHPSSRGALPCPTCQASLLRWGAAGGEPMLIFSNPAVSRAPRRQMTIKVSADGGMTWPERWHTLYDERIGNGYSCLAPAGNDKVAVLYESVGELYFLRIPVSDLLGKTRSDK